MEDERMVDRMELRLAMALEAQEKADAEKVPPREHAWLCEPGLTVARCGRKPHRS